MSLEDLNKALETIKVIDGNPHQEAVQATRDHDDDRTPEENWNVALNSLKQYSKARKWDDCMEVLTFLANQDNNPEMMKARAHASWLALKTQAPVAQATQVLYKLLMTLGSHHELAGPLASTANLLFHHRTPDHPDRPLAESHVQQMLLFASNLEMSASSEEVQAWVRENRLDEPETFVPKVMESLEMMIGNEWWIDKEVIQQELERDQPPTAT